MSRTSPTLSTIGVLKIAGEETFGEDASENGKYLRTNQIDTSTLEFAVIRQEFTRSVDYETSKILGALTGTLKVTVPLFGYSSSVPEAALTHNVSSGASATAFQHLAEIYGSAFGNFGIGGYNGSDTVTASGDPTDTILVSEAGTGLSTFAVGEPVCWETDEKALPYYVGWLTDIDETKTPNDEGTLLQTTPPYDPQGSTLHGGYHFWTPTTGEMQPYHSNADNSHPLFAEETPPAASWTLDFLGHGTDRHAKMYGCEITGLKFSFAVGEIPTAELTFSVSHWEETGSGGEPAVQTWTYPEPEAALGWYVAWGAAASDGDGHCQLAIKSLEIDLGLARVPLMSGCAESGIAGYYTTKRDPTVKFMVHREFSEELGAFVGQTGLPFTFQHGSQPGKIFAFCIPYARISEFPAVADDAGAVMSDITLTPTYYSGDTGTESEIVPINSAFRMAII